MKRYSIYLTIVLVASLTLWQCNRADESESNFDNVIYLETAKNTASEALGIRNKDTELTRVIQASLALPAGNDIEATVKANNALVGHYNTINQVSYEALPGEFFELSDTKVMIAAGEVRSTDITLKFKNLENLPRGVTLILPVTLESASNMNILKGAQTYYYILKKGAPITVAANIKETALYVPTMATTGMASGLNALTQVTMEALVRAHGWGEGGEAGISSLMGIESYYLIRMGDSNYEDQIQVAAASFGGNWPARDAAKRLKKEQWYHVALTFNVTSGEQILYVNGKVQAQVTQGAASSINLTRVSGSNPTNRFFIGKSWSDNRYFSGEICEVRIWNTVRTQEELNQYKYEVSPATPGLVAYWKFDEGEGSVIHDYTENGNDLSPAPKEGNNGYNNPVTWVPVELGGE
jgi:molybdopterin-binding protein